MILAFTSGTFSLCYDILEEIDQRPFASKVLLPIEQIISEAHIGRVLLEPLGYVRARFMCSRL